MLQMQNMSSMFFFPKIKYHLLKIGRELTFEVWRGLELGTHLVINVNNNLEDLQDHMMDN